MKKNERNMACWENWTTSNKYWESLTTLKRSKKRKSMIKENMEKSLWTKSKNLKRNTSKKAKSSYKRTVSTKTSKPMKMSTGSA